MPKKPSQPAETLAHVHCKCVEALEGELKWIKARLAASARPGLPIKDPYKITSAKGADWMDNLSPADRRWWEKRNGGAKK